MDSLAKNEVFRAYVFYSGILLVKVMAMSFLTAKNRFKKGVFANPEDAVGNKKAKVVYNDEDVERVRRAHLNDLENVIPFIIIALFYTLTNPVLSTATLLFRVYTAARFLHTFVYAVMPIPQPARALAWGVGIFIQFYLAINVIIYFK